MTRAEGKSLRLYPGALVRVVKRPGREYEKVETWLAWKRVADVRGAGGAARSGLQLQLTSVRSPRTLGAGVVVLPLSPEGVIPGRRKFAAEQPVLDEDALPSHVVFEFSQCGEVVAIPHEMPEALGVLPHGERIELQLEEVPAE